jgi:hypothetical protein
VAIMADVMRVSLIGAGPGSEVFDTSFWLWSGAPATGEAANTLAAQIRDLWAAGPVDNTLRALLTANQNYTEVRVYSYPNGGPNAGAIGVASIALADGQGNGSGRGPLQQTMVATLLTPFAGRRSRGRMYLPAAGLAVGSDNQWPQANCTTVANDLAAFLSAVQGIAAIGNVSVISQVGAGLATPVNRIRVDTKPDIQRRRANKIAPTAVSFANVV